MGKDFMQPPVPDEISVFIGQVKELVEAHLDPISLQVERDDHIPAEAVEKMKRLGLFGMAIPIAYGGLGFSTLAEIRVYQELTKTNACFRSRIGTSNSIGSMGIVCDGTDEQRRRYLPRIASGEWTAAFALTEPDAGSDASGIKTSAVREGEHWVVNGTKQFITNADCAHVFTTVAVTDEVKRARGGFTAFLIEKDTPGFSIGPADRKMGLRGSHTNELVFRNCRIPAGNVIGGDKMVGQGFGTAMRVLDKGRLTMGACALGASQYLMERCVEDIRRQIRSGTAPETLQAAQFAVADMAVEIHAARRMLHHAARLRDQGQNVSHEASMVKLFCTELAGRVADRAMDLLADEACLTKSRVEMFLRDVRLYRIFEGSSEIQRTLIARNLLKE